MLAQTAIRLRAKLKRLHSLKSDHVSTMLILVFCLILALAWPFNYFEGLLRIVDRQWVNGILVLFMPALFARNLTIDWLQYKKERAFDPQREGQHLVLFLWDIALAVFFVVFTPQTSVVIQPDLTYFPEGVTIPAEWIVIKQALMTFVYMGFRGAFLITQLSRDSNN